MRGPQSSNSLLTVDKYVEITGFVLIQRVDYFDIRCVILFRAQAAVCTIRHAAEFCAAAELGTYCSSVAQYCHSLTEKSLHG